VIGVLRYLEARINAMIAIWGDDARDVAAPAAAAAPAVAELDQADVDMVLQPADDVFAPEPAEFASAVEPAVSEPQADAEPTASFDTAYFAEEREADDGPAFGFAGVADVSEPEAPAFATEPAVAEPVVVAAVTVETVAVEAAQVTPAAVEPVMPEPVTAEPVADPVAAQAPEPPPAPAPTQPARDPLADIRALSEEEKIALCS
jgi:hypothetical protein